MSYFDTIRENLSDLEYQLGVVTRDKETFKRDALDARRELAEIESRVRYSRLVVNPFMHPDGKITTIKMVRILEQSSLVEAKNKVDGWVRDGLVTDPKLFEYPVHRALPWRKSAPYIKGTEVTHNGRTFRATRDILTGDCDMGGPGSDTCYTGHWEKVEPGVPQFVAKRAYKKGDRVILNGELVEAKRDIDTGMCDARFPHNFERTDGRLCMFDHWKKVGEESADII